MGERTLTRFLLPAIGWSVDVGKKAIASVCCRIPGGLSEYIDFDSKASLLDWDIILFSPDITAYINSSYSTYQGKSQLNDDRSFHLKEAAGHWKRELSEAVRAGKTIFVLMSGLREVYVDTGKRTYSGSGRNQQTTTLVTGFNNYEAIPVEMSVTASEGKRMKPTRQGELLVNYWKEFGNHSEYKVSISGKIGVPLLQTTTGGKTVSAMLRGAETGGALILLPYLDLQVDEFFDQSDKDSEVGAEPGLDDEYEDGETDVVWTEQATKFGQSFLNCLLAIDKALRESSSVTPMPAWANAPLYVLPAEAGLREELLKVENILEELSSKKEDLKTRILQEGSLRRLLYEKGNPLEMAVLQALQLLGFQAERYRDPESEFDVVFECAEGRLLGEVEGKDNSAVNVDKLRQLGMNIHEDFARDGITEMAKGVLLGNAYRLLSLDDRQEYFTAKCMTAAKQSRTALVRTSDLFRVAQYLSGEPEPEFAKECRKALLTSEGGIVSFPAIPQGIPASETSETTESRD